MAVIGNAPFQGLVSGGNIIDASIEGVDLSTSAIAARLGYTPVDPGAATFTDNPTISSGTANGVGYLNGSKVFTTGTALTFDGTNLGIGTSSPAADLEIKRTGAVNVKLQVTSAYESALWLVNGGGSEVSVINAGGSNILSVRTNNTERMRIDSSGNLGIGTTSPSVKLDVAGNATIQNGVLTIGKDTVYDAFINTPESMYFNVDSDGNSTGNRFVWGTDRTGTSGGTEWMRLDSSGNLIVIGNKIIGINGTGVAAGTFAFRNSSGVQKSAIGSYYNIADEGNLEFINSNTTNMVLTSSGNVAIGNSTAWSRLHVTKTVNNSNTAATNITDYQNAAFILHNQDEVGTGNKAGMFFAFAGSPGILAGMDGYKVNGTWETGLRWYTNSQTGINTGIIYERMRLDQNGNLGIGNTSPSWKLDVAGAQESLASFRSSITTGAGYARFINGGGTFYIGIESSNGTRISNSGLAYAASMTTEGSTALTFGTNNTNRMTIDTTGRVLIGTITPTQTGNLFEVNRSQAGQTCAHVVNTSTGSAYAEAVITTSAYNTGLLIGSIGGNVTTYGIANIAGVPPAGVSYLMQFSSYPMVINHYAAQPIVFGTGNVERMRVGSTGNIGIGTTAVYNSAKLSVAGSAEIRGDIRSYFASRAGLASGASVTLWSVPNGYWGTEVSMTLYVSQRDDNVGALSNATYNITAFASGGVVITSQGASTYGASKPFTLTASSGSGGMSVSFTNNAAAASTGITIVANVLVGYGAINWGF